MTPGGRQFFCRQCGRLISDCSSRNPDQLPAVEFIDSCAVCNRPEKRTS